MLCVCVCVFVCSCIFFASPNHQQTPRLFCSAAPKNSLQPASWGVKIFSAVMKPRHASLMIFESLSFCPNNAAAGMKSSHIEVSWWWNHQQSPETKEAESSYISFDPVSGWEVTLPLLAQFCNCRLIFLSLKWVDRCELTQKRSNSCV